MLRRTCVLLAVVAVSRLLVVKGEQKSQSTMSGHSASSSYRVDTSSFKEHGEYVQRFVIDGNGIKEDMKIRTPSSVELSVVNTGNTLIIGDPKVMNILLFSNKPGTLVVLQDGVCTEKTYHTSSTGTSSSSRRLSDSQCQEVRRKAEQELEKNREYWDKWGKKFDKDMKDTFPPGFPFHDQHPNFGSAKPSGNFYDNMAHFGSTMQKTFMPEFPFKTNK